MATQQHMVRALTLLRPMVQLQDFDRINELVAQYGLDFLISDEFIDFARGVQDASSVIFLCTLAVHNAANPVRAQMLLQAYQSIVGGVLTEGIAQLPKRHVLRQTIAALAHKAAIPAPRLDSQKRKGTGQEWLLALELCMDHGALENGLVLMREHMQRTGAADYVLLCAKALIERASSVTEGDSLPWAAWIALQTAVYEELKRQKFSDVAERVAQLAGEYCHFSGNPADSIAWHEKIPASSDRSIISLYQIARGHCHLGQTALAIAHMDQVLARMCTQSNDWINQNFLHADAAGEKADKASFNQGAAALALTDLQNTLSQVDVSPFLVSGTLLGYARNRGFLSHDKDIDVGIFASQDIFDVLSLLSRSGLFEVKFHFLRVQDTYQVPIVHRTTGMNIDIFVYHPQGERLVTGVHGNFGYTQNFTFTPFTLQTVRFLDIDFAVPANMALNLQENFGPWQVPDPHFISHLECPTTVDIGGAVYMVVARQEMLRSVVEGKKVKVARIAAILRRWQSADYPMDPSLIERLVARFGMAQDAAPSDTPLETITHA